jgi:hypothetical protein
LLALFARKFLVSSSVIFSLTACALIIFINYIDDVLSPMNDLYLSFSLYFFKTMVKFFVVI